MVPTCKARGEEPGTSWPWAQSHPRAHEQAGQREGGCVSKSSQLLFHLLALLDGPLGTQATLPFSVTGSFFHPGRALPTALPVTGRSTASGSPPCPEKEESLRPNRPGHRARVTPRPELGPPSLKSPAPWHHTDYGVIGAGLSPCPALGLLSIALLHGGWE